MIFRNEQLSVIASVCEVCDYSFGYFAVVGCFKECSVRRTLARSVETVTIVEYDMHCRRSDGSRIPLAKVEKFCYICRKFAKANLLIAMTLVPIVRHGVFSFR